MSDELADAMRARIEAGNRAAAAAVDVVRAYMKATGLEVLEIDDGRSFALTSDRAELVENDDLNDAVGNLPLSVVHWRDGRYMVALSDLRVRAEDLKPGMRFDISPLWTAEYAGEDNYGLFAFADSELAEVESTEVRDGMVLIYLASGPSNAIAPVGMEFDVDHYACAECGGRALDPATDTLGGAPICRTCLDDYLAENGSPTVECICKGPLHADADPTCPRHRPLGSESVTSVKAVGDYLAGHTPCEVCGYLQHGYDCPKFRLEELRAALRAGNISYGELAELQGMADQIPADDVELREAAGLPEFPEDDDTVTVTIVGRTWRVEPGTAQHLEQALMAAKKGGAYVEWEGDDE